MLLVRLDTRRIIDWDTFHDTFSEAFGFPKFYGRNMNAWIGCMTCLGDAEAGMTNIHIMPGELLALQLDYAEDLHRRFPEAYNEIVECSAFVNYRLIENGWPPALALSFYK